MIHITMADATQAVGSRNAGLAVFPLVLAVLVAVVVSVGALGGAAFWLVKSGRVSLAGGPTKVEAATKGPLPKLRLVTLDPMLVNLADEGGKAYLRITLVLRVEDPPLVKGAKKEDAQEGKTNKGKLALCEDDVLMRDAALQTLGRETAQELLAADGKQHLKEHLRTSLQARVSEVKLVDVLFTDFLVQR